ncbi:macro domain-containing protein [Nocardia yamanashiensis]|uniref:macro domain-containing protein n=1 Tax=Nocardia yamanashiensis TaxID=209247 RepID=UPI0038CD2295
MAELLAVRGDITEQHVAGELGAETVAFPAISTGIYRWPLDDGARIAVETVRAAATSVRQVRFVLFGDEAEAAFRGVLGV